MRVLMANEPRSHHEVFAGALRALRPHVEAITIRPDALGRETPRLRVCRHVTPALGTAAGRRIEARLEEGALLVRTSVAGDFPDSNPGLDVLLQFVDHGEERPARQSHDARQRFGGLR